MFFLIVAVAVFCLGWYLSIQAREYFEVNWRNVHHYLFGPPKETRPVSVSKVKCFCKQPNCQRFLTHNLKFHESQIVTERISDSLENLFDCILERYVDKWYQDISNNDDFIDDIKMNLHFICDNAVYRLKKVDLSRFVCRSVVPIAARHLHMCMAAGELNRPSSSLHQSQDDRLFEKLSGHLHVAMKSRTIEQLYIRSLVTAILPHLLHNTVHVHSRATVLFLEELLSVAVLLPALDVLATPDIVNKLILLGLNNEPAPKPTDPVSQGGKILKKYHKSFRSRFDKPIPVTNIHSLYGNTVLFHQFMQYLKSINLVDLLNVFGQLDEINSKVLQPEIPEAVKDAIHRDLALLHESLAHEPSLPLLQLPDSFLNDILRLAKGPASQVHRLQTCDSWFKAYDSVCKLLETVLLPQFFESDCFFDAQFSSAPGHATPKSSSSMETVSVETDTVDWSISGGSATSEEDGSLKRKDFSFAKFTGKVKDMLKFQSVVEGEFPPGPPTTQQAEDAAVMLLPAGEFNSDETGRSECADEIDETDGEVHDLSTWEVSMPTISQGYRQSLIKSESLYDEAGRRGSAFGQNFSPNQFTFVIEVREKGINASVWRIHRRYQEFYVLHEKLCEFHGSHLHDVTLPSKKSFGVKNFDFLEQKKPEFEQYLTVNTAHVKRLLSKPFLHNSELLYRFLRQSDLEFNSGINLGKFMKSVNIKLIKTRGQHLSSFMQTLHSSTEGRKPVPRAAEPRVGRSLRDTNLHNHAFWNNAVGAVRLRQNAIQQGTMTPGCDLRFPHLSGIIDVTDWIMQWASSTLDGVTASKKPATRSSFVVTCIRSLLCAVKPFLEPIVESALSRAISRALVKVLQEHRLVPIVEALRDVLFFDNGSQRSLVEKQDRREAANLAVLNLLLHPPLHLIFDQEQLTTQLHDVFSLLQLPKVNKQLSYVLLDDLVQELFPEISINAIKDSISTEGNVASSSAKSGPNGDIATGSL